MFLDKNADLLEIAGKFSCSVFFGDPDLMARQFAAHPRAIMFEKDAKKAGITVDVSSELVRLNTALPASTKENPNFLVVKNAELLNEHASNALLKTFEEARQLFVLLARTTAQILPTITSRSAIFYVPMDQSSSQEAVKIASQPVVEMASSLDKKPELAIEVLNLLAQNLAKNGDPNNRIDRINSAAQSILNNNSVKLALLSYL